LKSSSSEQGDLGSASNLGNQQCSGEETLISAAKAQSGTGRRENTGWVGGDLATSEVVRLAV